LSAVLASLERKVEVGVQVAERWILLENSKRHDIMISMGKEECVAQFVVRNIEKEVKVRLQRRASRHGRSMEEEVRDILRNAVNEQDVAVGGLGTEIASMFAKVGLDEEIPELRGYETKPASFDR
jgi:plasmid stability protein